MRVQDVAARLGALMVLWVVPRPAGCQQMAIGVDASERPLVVGADASGAIRGALVVASDRVFILDGESNRVIEFFRTQERNSWSTKLHRLPNVAEPVVVAGAGMDRMLVVDARGGGVAWFRMGPDGLMPAGSVAGSLSAPSGACFLGGESYVLGLGSQLERGDLVHVIARDGRETLSFGAPFGEGSGFAQIAYAFGHAACLDGDGMVVIASRLFPEVRAYSSEGRLHWTRRIPSFQGIEIREMSAGAFRYEYGTDSVWDEVGAMFSPAPGRIAVQVHRRRGRGVRGGPAEVRTLFLDARRGTVLATQVNLPRILAAAHGLVVVVRPESAQVLLKVYRYADASMAK